MWVSDYKIGIRKESSFPLHRTLCYLLLCLVVLVNGLPCLCHDNIFICWEGTVERNSAIAIGFSRLQVTRTKVEFLIPARFSLQLLKNHEMELKLNQMRRLLNTEKLIFKAESLKEVNNKAGLNVLVTLEPEGIVAIPNSRERYFIIYNIVCEEQLMGIPYSSWSVVLLVALCLVVSFIVPRSLPSSLLTKDQGLRSSHRSHGKDS
ncbi:hypothetical protein AtEden1_Chr1g0077691 [Arabidopsis thaliana]